MDRFPTFRRVPGALQTGTRWIADVLSPAPEHVAAALRGAPVTVMLTLGLILLHAIPAIWGGESALETLVVAWSASGIEDGRWWTAVTSGFIHMERGHLQANLIWIVPLGLLLEPRMGSLQTSILVVLGAIAASAGSHLLEASGGYGASGISFAFAGAMLSRPIWTDSAGRRVYNGAWPFFAVLTAVLLQGGIRSGTSSFSAHVVGLVAGLWFGTVRWKEDPVILPPRSRTHRRLAVAAFSVAYALALLPAPRWQLPWHETRMLDAESRGDHLKATEHWWAIVRSVDPSVPYDSHYLVEAGFFSRRHDDESWAMALLTPAIWRGNMPWLVAEIGFMRAAQRPPDLRGAMSAWKSAWIMGHEDPYVLNAMAETFVFFAGDSTLHHPRRGVDFAQQAVAADTTCNAQFMHTLAWCHFESGNRPEGIHWMEAAVSIADSTDGANWSDDLRWMRERAAGRVSLEARRPRGYIERITL